MYHICCTGFLVTTIVHLPDPFCCFHPLCCVMYVLYFNTLCVSLPYLTLPSHYHFSLSNFYHYHNYYYLCFLFLLHTSVHQFMKIIPLTFSFLNLSLYFYPNLSNLATSFTASYPHLFPSSSSSPHLRLSSLLLLLLFLVWFYLTSFECLCVLPP